MSIVDKHKSAWKWQKKTSPHSSETWLRIILSFHQYQSNPAIFCKSIIILHTGPAHSSLDIKRSQYNKLLTNRCWQMNFVFWVLMEQILGCQIVTVVGFLVPHVTSAFQTEWPGVLRTNIWGKCKHYFYAPAWATSIASVRLSQSLPVISATSWGNIFKFVWIVS